MRDSRQFQLLVQLLNLVLVTVIIYLVVRLTPIWQPFWQGMIKVLLPFIISAFIAYLLHPIIEGLHGRNVPRPLAVILIYLVFFGGVAYGVYKLTPIMIQQLKDLSKNIPQFHATYQAYLMDMYNQTAFLPDGVHDRIDEFLQKVQQRAESIIEVLLNSTGKIINSFFILAVIPFIVFYLLKDYPLVKKVAWYLTPTKWRKPLWYVLRDVNKTLGQYIRGQLFVCVAIGGAATLAFWLVGMKYALILGILIGLTNVIPYFGPIIGAVPALIIAFTVSIKMVIIVVVIIILLQFLEGNLLSPIIVGKSLHMHPIFIIFALIAGGEVGGIIGLIIAVPLLSVVKVIVLHLVEHFSKH
ncbi:AI-2E family transporter [Bacillus solimangrovi]|uniref:AI-2E family transporter n=1 Tax=Bacillus solimangrovi TaxID=1305675 RepID=A0A1E5LBP3_9BACI|nr:AI-2E family transporter [Bacillus solimangrovi]OEH91514.1 AI-2E family transporter [Bacillus solimangrovi]